MEGGCKVVTPGVGNDKPVMVGITPDRPSCESSKKSFPKTLFVLRFVLYGYYSAVIVTSLS